MASLGSIKDVLHGTERSTGFLEKLPLPARSLVAGAFSGLVETSLTHPLDLSEMIEMSTRGAYGESLEKQHTDGFRQVKQRLPTWKVRSHYLLHRTPCSSLG